jgi:hypothetical protein
MEGVGGGQSGPVSRVGAVAGGGRAYLGVEGWLRGGAVGRGWGGQRGCGVKALIGGASTMSAAKDRVQDAAGSMQVSGVTGVGGTGAGSRSSKGVVEL